MLTNDQKLETLNKILGSRYFLNSQTSTALLKFLLDKTINETDITETVIGLYIFGNHYDREKSNARIRVSVYHLRKKLEQYYKKEGSGDEWKLIIEKGQYHVTFIKNKNNNKFSNLKPGIHLKYVSAILLLVVLYVIVNIKPSVPIWDPYFSNNKETVLYIGDVYGFLGKTLTGGWGWQRDYEINSDEEFIKKKEELNLGSNEVEISEYTYISVMEAYAVKNITQLFMKQKRDFAIRLVSEINEKDIRERNIIYVGLYKNNNRLIQLFAEQHSQFKYESNILFIRDSVDNNYHTVWDYYSKEYGTGENLEIVIVAKMNGIHGNQQFLFFSDHDMGGRATVEYFTNLDTLKKFNKTYLKDRDTFTAIFLVAGRDRVDLGIKLLDVY